MNKLRIKKILLIMMILSLLVSSGSSLHMGKGELCKATYWENGGAIPGATVALDIDGDGTPDILKITDGYGVACFPGLTYGTYYIYVDIDNDGVWDTEAEEVVVDQIFVTMMNEYNSLPEMWRFEE